MVFTQNAAGLSRCYNKQNVWKQVFPNFVNTVILYTATITAPIFCLAPLATRWRVVLPGHTAIITEPSPLLPPPSLLSHLPLSPTSPLPLLHRFLVLLIIIIIICSSSSRSLSLSLPCFSAAMTEIARTRALRI